MTAKVHFAAQHGSGAGTTITSSNPNLPLREAVAEAERVLLPGESVTVEVGDETYDRMAFFNDWFELTGFWPVGADHIMSR